jgi:type IV secretory pathway VirJ component
MKTSQLLKVALCLAGLTLGNFASAALSPALTALLAAGGSMTSDRDQILQEIRASDNPAETFAAIAAYFPQQVDALFALVAPAVPDGRLADVVSVAVQLAPAKLDSIVTTAVHQAQTDAAITAVVAAAEGAAPTQTDQIRSSALAAAPQAGDAINAGITSPSAPVDTGAPKGENPVVPNQGAGDIQSRS